jgi:O-antigen/teichoic acid export membrane protein
MHPRKFVRDSVGYALVQYLVRATVMFRGVIAARFLGPGLYGAWNAIQIMIDYGALAPAGTQQGLDQMVPPRIVAGDAAALARVKRAALFNICLLSGAFAVACMLVWRFGHSVMLQSWGAAGVGAAMICAVTTNLAYYQMSVTRSHGDISTSSGQTLIQGAVGAGLGLVLLPWLQGWGLLLGWTIGCVAAFAFSTVRSRPYAPLSPSPSAESFDLVQIGLPMFVFIASALVMRNLDRIIILRYLGTQDLGYYSLSVMALTFLLYMPDSVTYVMYPRLLHAFGESSRDPASIRPSIERVLQAISVLVPFLSGLAFLFAQPAVSLILPKFLPGVGALRILCFGAVALAFSNLASIVMMTIGRQLLLVPVAIFGVGLYAVLDFAAVKMGYGITGVASATLVAYVINSAVLLGLALAGIGLRAKALVVLLGKLFAPCAVGLALAFALEHWMPWAGARAPAFVLLRLGVSTAVFALVFGFVVYPLTRGMGMRQTLSEFNVPVLGPLLRRMGMGAPPREDA